LSEDDLPTDLGVGFSPRNDVDDAETEIPARRAVKDFLDYDEEEETQMGRLAAGDVTEIESSASMSGPFGILWVMEGHRRGHIYKIKEGSTVGRKDGDLILDDPKVSSMHAKFTYESNHFVVWDFGSVNGTHVNGKRIRQATPLNENDLVKFGDTVFVVKLLDAPPQEN
jgi:hypothetical protein